MSIEEAISKNLQEKMLEYNVTVRGLSQMCGVSQPTMWRYIHGQGNPQIENLEKIAKSLGMDVTDLIK